MNSLYAAASMSGSGLTTSSPSTPETGEVLFDSKVDQSEREIRAALSPLCAAGKVRVVVDEPGPMSRLLFAVAKDMGMEIGFLTPRAMAKAIEMYGGDIKTDRARCDHPRRGRIRNSEAGQGG